MRVNAIGAGTGGLALAQGLHQRLAHRLAGGAARVGLPALAARRRLRGTTGTGGRTATGTVRVVS